MNTSTRNYPHRTQQIANISPEELAIIGPATWNHAYHYCNCHDEPDEDDYEDDSTQRALPGDQYMSQQCEQNRSQAIYHQQARLNQLRTYVNARIEGSQRSMY